MSSTTLQVMDITSLKAVIADLRKIILPSRFEKAQQPEPGTIQIGLRTLEKLVWIEISWNAMAPRLVQIPSPSRIGSESTLAKQIQHGLHQLALVEIKQTGFERIVEFVMADRPKGKVQKVLLVELMGRHSNLLLLDHQKKIITLGRQVRSHQSRVRPITTGDKYVNPPRLQGNEPNSKESFSRWKERLCLIPSPLKKAIQESYQGISPSIALQLVNDEIEQAKKILSLDVSLLSQDEWLKLYKRWKMWLQSIENENTNIFFEGPTTFKTWGGKVKKNSPERSISILLGNYYRRQIDTNKLNQITKELENKLDTIKDCEEKYLNHQEELLKKIPSSELIQRQADDLLCIPSPNSSTIEKAQKLYQKAKKLKRSLPEVKQRISYHQSRLVGINESIAFLDELQSNKWEEVKYRLQRVIELKNEIDEFQTYSSNKNRTFNNSAKQKNKPLIPLSLKTPGGLEVQVGRNHRQNELISLRNSRSGDIWFHAQECPGSHVVLKASNGMAEQKDIQMAADLAAFFSRGKGNKRVPVIMVDTDNLQRIPGATPGTVRHRKSSLCWGVPARGSAHIKVKPP